MTTRANSQFPRPDFHRLDKQPYGLRVTVRERILASELSDEDRHGFALLLDDIPDRLLHIRILPEPSRASMARPALSLGSIAASRIYHFYVAHPRDTGLLTNSSNRFESALY